MGRRGARRTLLAGLCVGLICLGVGTSYSQQLASGRASTDSCEQPNPPPNSPAATSDQGPVVFARYVGATDAYRHGVLGDAIEATGLLVRSEDGGAVVCETILAGKGRVFEDVGPRLIDLDRDGVNEVVVVASHANYGARLEVYGYRGAGSNLQRLAETRYIGTPHRWLAPVGAADLDGDGSVELAYIDRPHLNKTLRVFRYGPNGLAPVADLPGFSNHRIGWDFIVGGIRSCANGPEIVLPSGDWRTIQAISLSPDGKLTAREIAPYDGVASVRTALTCAG